MPLFYFQKHLKKNKKIQQTFENQSNWDIFFVALLKITLKRRLYWSKIRNTLVIVPNENFIGNKI